MYKYHLNEYKNASILPSEMKQKSLQSNVRFQIWLKYLVKYFVDESLWESPQ